MECVFQLVRPDVGYRSDPLKCERSKFAGLLVQAVRDGGVKESDIVLVVAQCIGEEMELSKAPLMTVERFCDFLGKPVDLVSEA